MRRFGLGLALMIAVVLVPGVVRAQSIDDLNLQVHGYVVQAFVKSNQNSWNTTDSENGSASWNEAVVNLSLQPQAKLKIGVQGRFQLLGDSGGDGNFTVDWAQLDYTANSYFGFRVGDVKTPMGLLNETQDIDPSYIWSLLPQGVYPIGSRNSVLSHFGGVVYGALKLGQSLGKLEYRGWGGERVMGSDDGYFVSQREAGLIIPNGVSGVTLGAAIHWKAPLPGLLIGASDSKDTQWSSNIAAGGGALSGTETVKPMNFPSYFARYEKDKVMVAAEWFRLPVRAALNFTGLPPTPFGLDQRTWYAMASYRVTDKLTAGMYDSQSVDHHAALGPARHSLDWTVSGRYDFNQFLYAKAEQHFIDGAELSYDADLNPNGLKPNTKLTILKVGVSF